MFLLHVFFLWLHVFILHEAIGNVLPYLFTPIVCLSKVSNYRIYCTWSKSHPLVDIRACTLCKVSLSSYCFSAKYWTGHRYFICKKELYCALTRKKNQYSTGICLLLKWKRNGPNGMQWHRVSARVRFLRFWRNKLTADALTVCLCVFRDAQKTAVRTKLRRLYVPKSKDCQVYLGDNASINSFLVENRPAHK